jgi:hypothetical protein
MRVLFCKTLKELPYETKNRYSSSLSELTTKKQEAQEAIGDYYKKLPDEKGGDRKSEEYQTSTEATGRKYIFNVEQAIKYNFLEIN